LRLGGWDIRVDGVNLILKFPVPCILVSNPSNIPTKFTYIFI